MSPQPLLNSALQFSEYSPLGRIARDGAKRLYRHAHFAAAQRKGDDLEGAGRTPGGQPAGPDTVAGTIALHGGYSSASAKPNAVDLVLPSKGDAPYAASDIA